MKAEKVFNGIYEFVKQDIELLEKLEGLKLAGPKEYTKILDPADMALFRLFLDAKAEMLAEGIKKSGQKELAKLVKDIVKNGMKKNGRVYTGEYSGRVFNSDGFRATLTHDDFGAMAVENKNDITGLTKIFEDWPATAPAYELPTLEAIRLEIGKKSDIIECRNSEGQAVIGYNPKWLLSFYLSFGEDAEILQGEVTGPLLFKDKKGNQGVLLPMRIRK